MSGNEQKLDDNCVLIAGGGPVGMLTATVLAYYGIQSLILERNETTTKWPKMDLTNARSMELLRKVGVADMIREKGVPSPIPYSVLFSTGLNSSSPLSKWDLLSVDAHREIIASSVDGTQPQEPYQRISQALFEAALRKRCDENPLIDLRFGWKVESVEESDDLVKTVVTDLSSSSSWLFSSHYLIACDGASSRVRRSLQIALEGGPTPVYARLVHFKSRDLTRIHKHGQFWHYFTVSETHGLNGALIAQDEVDTWTAHLFFPVEYDSDHMEPEDVVATVLGGMTGLYPVKIDEVLVRSTYRPHIAVARTYSGEKKRVFLAGDSAHQNVPTGGYGMNMGIADAFGIGWQLAAVINGHGGRGLLAAYEQERRPVALISVEESGKHLAVHTGVVKILSGKAQCLLDETNEASELLKKLDAYYQKHDAENKSIGVEMGYRYQSNVIISDDRMSPPEFDPRQYKPSTWPGMRAPHVTVRSGKSLFNLMGPMFTLVEFSSTNRHGAELLIDTAGRLGVPLTHLCLEGEDMAFNVWGERLVIIRPDFHVAWRSDRVEDIQDAEHILRTISGYEFSSKMPVTGEKDQTTNKVEGFSSTVSFNVQKEDYEFDKMGQMQM